MDKYRLKLTSDGWFAIHAPSGHWLIDKPSIEAAMNWLRFTYGRAS